MPESDGYQKWTVTKPYIDNIQGSLLEGPHFDESRNEFRFVDIWDHKIFVVDLDRGPESLRVVDTETAVSVTANIARAENSNAYEDQVIVGAKYGYALANLQTGQLTYLSKVWEGEGEDGGAKKATTMRFNDGAVDSHGRFWAGAMNDQKVKPPSTDNPEGVLFRLDPDLKLHRVVDGLTIPNGIGWNDKDDTMYVTDSLAGRIYAFDFDAESGGVGKRRVHYEDEMGGEPDGFAMDVEGCIWSAIYGRGKVVRVSPGGEVIGEVLLPTRNVTCCVFVGKELFITTAKDEEEDESQRLGGKVFRVDVGIEGQRRHEFRLCH